MKITVLGCGAIGKLWLAALFQQGHRIQGWLRVPQPSISVQIENLNGKETLFHQPILANDEKHLAESELLLVCLKAWQTSDAINELTPKMSPRCPILLIQNGMGARDEFLPLPNPLLLGVTTQGAYQQNDLVYHKAQGITHIGSLTPNADNLSGLADILHNALPDVAWHNEIYPVSWMKLAVNCVINPLTAIYDCKNGELKNHYQQIQQLCHEIHDVMKHEGIHTTKQALINYVMNVIEQSSENYSSMLQDIQAQRHTEIDYITGFLIRKARIHGLTISENTIVYQKIKRKEEEYECFSPHFSGPRQ
ncbi:2-dehydropantoate 2-reductase [Xenorhabdus szentirmaii]|nr:MULTISPECIES: 2-dehydropantoate 2-reductase [Xenorhabdus]MBD2779514.1 2-dehydropantoate 2-reductase [Xenorhabdus sp. 38]MBD2790960.1 2-dehydropantoate 2-reductase [Xenorhabdus sp. CUL]MBD2801229.1 2-dehydropantoate 2-reductase [Xenorhabdus sp. M]MBD2803996.1 2-dehydropantoate 2-reductase [Xenorhabdus sp. ZM]MBD2820216.1 2-dehydropantoate 2-reductase [Xenorhabdus sp. 42]